MAPITTRVYIDGFNLYYGSVKDKPQYKWLNVHKMCKNILGNQYRIEQIFYFTAIIKQIPDAKAFTRQRWYLQALETVPNIKIIKGHFVAREKKSRLVKPLTILNSDRNSQVIKYATHFYKEEKGSDVNLASQLLIDTYEKEFKCAVIISNDSDLLAPIRKVRSKGKYVYIFNPHPNKSRSKRLNEVANKVVEITEDNLANSQFPEKIESKNRILKPKEWS